MRAKKLLSLLLVFAMAVSLLPVSVWAENEVTVTFTAGAHSAVADNSEGGLTQENVGGDSNTAIATITVKADTGYDFPNIDSWNSTNNTALSGLTVTKTDKDTLTIAGTPTAAVTLTLPDAEPETYTVTYDDNGGTGGSTTAGNATYGVDYTIITTAATAPSGKVFTGWNTAQDGSGTAYAVGDTVQFTDDVTLYAQWGDPFTATFYAGDGAGGPIVVKQTDPDTGIDLLAAETDGASITTSSNSGSTGTDITAPTGKVFDKWTLNGEAVTETTGVKLTENTIYFATWKDGIVVTFDLNGPSAAEIADSNIVDNVPEAITLASADTITAPSPDPTWADVDGVRHTFDSGKWYTDAACTTEWNFSNNVTESMTLYAKWTYGYTVTYEPGDTAVTKESNTSEAAVPYEDSDNEAGDYVLLDLGTTPGTVDFAYDGYTFLGWQVNGAGDPVAAGETIQITGNTTLTAVWAQNYIVTFDKNGADGSEYMFTSPSNSQSTTVAEGEYELPACAFTYTGNVFVGWKVGKYDETVYAPGDKVTVSSNITIYAQWSTDGVTVTFDADGGSAVAPQSFENGKTATEPDDPTKSGYKFDGWYLVTDGVMADTEFDFTTAVTADITLKAKWLTAYSVSFSAGAGTGTITALTDQLGEITLPDENGAAGDAGFTYPGHAFIGWKANATGDVLEAGATYNVTANVVLVAQWEDSYTVTFNGNGATSAAIDPQNVAENGKATRPASDPTKTGYRFDGWYTGTSAASLDAEAYDFDTPVTKSFTLYAKWTQLFTVTFNLNYTGATGAPEAQTVADGAKATKPTDPTREGWTFDGWFKEAATTTAYNFASETVTADVTVYAKWTQDTYAVKYNANGATGSKTDGSAVLNEEITLRDPVEDSDYTYPGYFFTGWLANNTGDLLAKGDKYTVTGKVTFYAQWEKACAVIFDTQGGSTVTGLTVKNGEKATKPTDPTYANHTFGGWFTDAACTTEYDFNTAVTGDITLYAKWTEYYTVTFDAGDDTAVIANTPAQVDAGEEYTIPAADVTTYPAGKTFAGWKVNGIGDVVKANDKYTPTADFVLVAQWAKAFEVSFNRGTGSTGSIAAVTVPEGDYTLPDEKGAATDTAFAKTGCAFLGWKVNGAGDTLEVGATIQVTKNIELVAQWADAANSATLTFNMGVGTPPAIDPQIIVKGETATKPEDPTQSDYLFAGWYADSNFTTEFDWTAAITADTTVYAKWDQAFTVDFNANGGTGTMADVSDVLGQYIVPASTFTREGYKFAGWLVNNAGEAVVPGDDESTESGKVEITITADTTLYATWTQVYTVTVENGTADAEAYAEGDTVTIKATVPEGQSFDKWTTETEGVTFADETAEETTFVMPGKAVTVTATFKSETRTATPENVEATLKVKTGEVTVKWDAVEGATKYAVYRKAKGGEWFLLSKKITETSFVDDGSILPMEANTKYYYCVKAGNPTMDKVWSFHSEVTTASRIITPLDPMTGVSAAVANGKITVSWTDNGAKYFTVYRYSKADGWVRLPAAKKLAAGTTSFVDETAVAGTAYKYCVKSYNGSWSIKSNNTKAVKA